jgi:hypothetical protein
VSTVTLGYYPMPREPSERLAAARFRAGGHRGAPRRRLGYLGVLRAARGLRLSEPERRLCPQSPLANTQCLRSPPRGWRRLAFELGGTDWAIWESCARPEASG